MKANVGRFGPYILHDNKFYSIPKPDDAWTIDAEKALEIIAQKRVADANKLVKEFSEDADLKILNGRWGPYLVYGKDNYKIPKGKEATSLTYDDCMVIVGADKRSEKKITAEPAKKSAPAKKKAPAKKVAKSAKAAKPKKGTK
jgi:DNA topoisomerase-1